MRRCPACNAVAPEAAAWCGLCHATLLGSELLEAPPDAPPGWRPPAWAGTAQPGQRWSRTRSSAVTFGLRGRLIATVLMVLPLWWFYKTAMVGGLAGLLIWTFVILPWALRDIWRRARVT